MGKIIGIVLVVALLGFGAYKILGSSVDRSNPDEVAAAFLKALKKEDLSRAKKYVVPEGADAWQASAKEKLSGMKTNAMNSFRESIPDEPTFSPTPAAQVPKGNGDKWMTAGNTNLSMKQVDGDWYVVSCSQP